MALEEGCYIPNMDAMILDEIIQDRSAKAFVVAIECTLRDINLLYTYGAFLGNKDSFGVKEHIVAHNVQAKYTIKDQLTLSVIYAKHKNKKDPTSSFYTDNYLRILASYEF